MFLNLQIFRKEPFFYGYDNHDQLVKIAKVLGTDELNAYLNKYHLELDPQHDALVGRQLISLISSFVMIIKTGRLTAKEAMAHPYSFQVRAAENSREQLGKKMNGFAKEEKGLYYLINPPTKKTSVFYDFVHCNNVSIHTWHNRLGHFPVNKMHLLDGVQCSRIKMN
ncbi:casein kinase II subunit alpha-2-like isoform X1 [Ipomoea triloba]|uniref:casein kinase II subunit alpha-2-like isoform X1 n=1 Tax=Ipomoea triloba TaxID=35885 RepID=UPI00125DED0F|nr:casein kinase II subunit alpha-2-like isoform X1 [Ipomoea triloba]